MTTLYRPVRIESAEQAEALPVGTIAHTGMPRRPVHVAVRIERRDGDPRAWMESMGVNLHSHRAMPGWTALVPIEAEEETRISETRSRWRGFKESRLVTPWEEA